MILKNSEQNKNFKKPNITYRNLVLLGLSFGGVVFFFQQLLTDLNIKFFHFKVGSLDLIGIIGFALSLYGSYLTFQKAINSEEKEEETTQYVYLLREIDQLAHDVGDAKSTLSVAIADITKSSSKQGERQGERLGELEQKVYANQLIFEHHERQLYHIGAQQQLAILENKLNTLEITLNILSRENEYALRIARLEEETKEPK